jgi:CheY-like chemotaxis protein
MRARILVVDDERDTADALARLIGILGHEAITAYSGPEAIEAITLRSIDMALIDIGMPGMDGYETAAAIRRRIGRQAILIAVSGWSRKEDKERAADAGFDLHYAKPLDVSSLENLLAIPEPDTLAVAGA